MPSMRSVFKCLAWCALLGHVASTVAVAACVFEPTVTPARANLTGVNHTMWGDAVNATNWDGYNDASVHIQRTGYVGDTELILRLLLCLERCVHLYVDTRPQAESDDEDNPGWRAAESVSGFVYSVADVYSVYGNVSVLHAFNLTLYVTVGPALIFEALICSAKDITWKNRLRTGLACALIVSKLVGGVVVVPAWLNSQESQTVLALAETFSEWQRSPGRWLRTSPEVRRWLTGLSMNSRLGQLVSDTRIEDVRLAYAVSDNITNWRLSTRMATDAYEAAKVVLEKEESIRQARLESIRRSELGRIAAEERAEQERKDSAAAKAAAKLKEAEKGESEAVAAGVTYTAGVLAFGGLCASTPLSALACAGAAFTTPAAAMGVYYAVHAKNAMQDAAQEFREAVHSGAEHVSRAAGKAVERVVDNAADLMAGDLGRVNADRWGVDTERPSVKRVRETLAQKEANQTALDYALSRANSRLAKFH